MVRSTPPSTQRIQMIILMYFRRPLQIFSAAAILATIFCSSIVCGQNDENTQGNLIPFHVPGDDFSETITSFASRVKRDAGSDGFVGITNGKFSVAGKRQRFWGVNLCFGANFPTHEQAVKIAAHFRKLGLNVVRFHHMDMQDAPGGIWRTKEDGTRELHPDQIDRLDYFLNELHKNGIYANINLHVSRTLTEAEGFPQLEKGVLWWTGSNKWVMYYDPDVQRELKKYCRDLLTHENPYRKLRRVDDPGIAIVEMLNENYFAVKGTELLERLPQKYQDSFAVKWNQWLKKKYGDTKTMRDSWMSQQKPMGEFLVEPMAWKTELTPWRLGEKNVSVEKIFGQQGPTDTATAVRFVPSGRSDQAFHMQLQRLGLSVKAKQAYTFKCWVRADEKREIGVELSTTAGGEWRDLGMFERVAAGRQWKEISRVVFPQETVEGEVALSINFGTNATPLEVAGVQLREGVEVNEWDAAQSIETGTVGVPSSGWSTASHADLQKFMVDTERSWLVELKSYLKDELGVKVPITASQENYHAPGVLAETCDFVDLHNYWHHPLFPGDAEWSRSKWTVDQQAIESAPTRSDWPANSILMRTGWRYHDMPFTLSEWNQGEPNVTGSGAVMMAAIIGATQDWDGIMFFNYTENQDRWFANRFEGWFDFAGHPVKEAVLAAAGNIYLRGDLAPLENLKSGTFADRIDGRAAFDYRIGIDTKGSAPDSVSLPQTNRFETPDGSLLWDATDPEKAFIRLNTPKSIGVWGLVAETDFAIGDAKISVGKVTHNYATIMLTSQDDLPITQSKSMLLLASSSAENTGMNWNEARNSIGENWGTGPTLINPVSATIRIAKSGLAGVPTVYSLDGTGKRTGKVSVEQVGSEIVFQIGSQHQTLWYEVEIN